MQRAQQLHLQQQQLVAQQLISTLSVEQREALARLPPERQVPTSLSCRVLRVGLLRNKRVEKECMATFMQRRSVL